MQQIHKGYGHSPEGSCAWEVPPAAAGRQAQGCSGGARCLGHSRPAPGLQRGHGAELWGSPTLPAEPRQPGARRAAGSPKRCSLARVV